MSETAAAVALARRFAADDPPRMRPPRGEYSMHVTTTRPPSPWSGSVHEARHRWQLDSVRSLGQAAELFRALAADLTAADAAGWRLQEPMRNGHLLAARPSRRARSQLAPGPAPLPPGAVPPRLSWRLRVVDEPPLPGDTVLRLGFDTSATPVVAWTGHAVWQISGPVLTPDVLAAITAQLPSADAGDRAWAVSPARVGPCHDVVCDGSALRVHAVHAGVLVRTVEALGFQHAADGARSLPAAAAAYLRLARAADAMTAAGAWLDHVDDGRVHVCYPHA